MQIARSPAGPVFLVSLTLAALAVVAPVRGAPADDSPFQTQRAFEPSGPLDRLMAKRLAAEGLRPALLCSDAVFIRRAHLDLTGTLPTADEVRRFLGDTSPDKRLRLVDRLITSDAFADYWALRWCDILRVKAEFPINLWPNGVQAYHRWIRRAIADNVPYDQFARELLTSSGSNFRVPAVNFHRAVQGEEPEAFAAAAALTFLGQRFETWPEAKRQDMAAFFSRIALKGTAEWKETIVYPDPEATETISTRLPDGSEVTIGPDEDPRRVFVDWLTSPDNGAFARCAVNRQWAWIFGRGIVHEPDDLRADNRPTHPAVLAYLERELVDSDYDLRHTLRLIVTSATYQQSPIARDDSTRSELLLACYPVRRLDAEVLIDALNGIYGGGEGYTSMIPEPFTYVPEEYRAISLADGSITSRFLEMFGRPSRDTGLFCERDNTPTKSQCMFLLNSSQIQKMIEGSQRVRQWQRLAGQKPVAAIRSMYLTILSRPPSPSEQATAVAYVKGSTRTGVVDLAWALTNSKEFLFRH